MVVLSQNYDMTTSLYIPEWAVMATDGKTVHVDCSHICKKFIDNWLFWGSLPMYWETHYWYCVFNTKMWTFRFLKFGDLKKSFFGYLRHFFCWFNTEDLKTGELNSEIKSMVLCAGSPYFGRVQGQLQVKWEDFWQKNLSNISQLSSRSTC